MEDPLLDPTTQNDDDDDNVEDYNFSSNGMTTTNVDQLPHVLLYGSNANLSGSRQEESRLEYFAQLEQQQQAPAIIDVPISCRLKWGDEDVPGFVFLSSCQVCFVETCNSVEPRDLAIGATCITLHAMTEEPELAIYLQLSEHNNNADYNYSDNDQAVDEVTIIPTDPESSQTLFDGLCKLVAKHPLQEDDEDDNDEDGGMMMMGGFNGGGGDNDEVIWAPAVANSKPAFDDDEEEGGATEAERAAMLTHLDNMLVIKPEFEIQDGQFDDADEEAE